MHQNIIDNLDEEGLPVYFYAVKDVTGEINSMFFSHYMAETHINMWLDESYRIKRINLLEILEAE
jgi:hypothetical protein